MSNATQTVGVLLPSALTEQFEIALARIVDLDRQGTRVKAIACNGKIKGCVSNPVSLGSICQHCRRVRDEALAQVAAQVVLVVLDYEFRELGEIGLPLSPSEAEGLEVGVDSTLLTFYRSDIQSSRRKPFRRWIYRKIADRYLKYSRFVYSSISILLQKKVINRLEFFNGRIVPTRGALLAAQKFGADFGVLEVAGRDRHMTVAEGSSVHDIDFKQEELRKFLLRPDLDLQSGARFFELRRSGEATNDKSFTTRQRVGKLQPRERPVLAIFTSSADELKVSGSQWFTEASQNPVAFIVELTAHIIQDFDVIVRMHPNQAGDKTGASETMIRTLSAVPNIDVILPNSDVSTYELIDLAKVVLTFGSTVGLEAAYWGKPSILAGRALWERQDIAYQVNDPLSAASLILGSPKPRSKKDALGVGAYYFMGPGSPGSLAWRYKGVTGFSVDGHNYIDLKRSAISYWITRAVDWIIKKS